VTDNDNLGSKLALRRYFLDRYHADDPPRVFDACQGSGVIWANLREDHPVATYWGCDLKRKAGRIRTDSADLIAAGLSEDVIDVDTYGSPWAHWAAVLKGAKVPRTVFLTIGEHGVRQRPLTIAEAELLGLSALYKRMPNKLKLRLAKTMTLRMISCAELWGFRIVELAESARGLSARYLGVRLEPIQAPAPSLPPAPGAT
tara:strand:+ start:9867 stop:10469 length:603 start_codon:yes stop_codon:yes gene_type:complete